MSHSHVRAWRAAFQLILQFEDVFYFLPSCIVVYSLIIVLYSLIIVLDSQKILITVLGFYKAS
jgi:hypothetical protein